MSGLTKVATFAVTLGVLVLAAGAGLVLSQDAENQPNDKLPCTDDPCKGYIYEVEYDVVTGEIRSAVARGGGAPPPGSGLNAHAGAAVIVLTDPNEQRLFGQLSNYYVDVDTLRLKPEPGAAPAPSPSDGATPFPTPLTTTLPPLPVAAGVGLSVLVATRAHRRRAP